MSDRRRHPVPASACVAVSVLLTVGAALSTGGCGVKRAYVAPVAAAPAAWGEAAPPVAQAEELAAWWSAFDDPQLTSLVTRAVVR